MTSPGAARTSPDRAWIGRLEAGIRNAGPRTLHVLPSTTEALACAGRWADEASWQIVGLSPDFKGHCSPDFQPHSPAEMLSRLGGLDPPDQPIIVFTDQCTSAEHAAWLLHEDDGPVYFPSFELVASVRYGRAVYCWDGDGLTRVPPAPDGGVALVAALRRYYGACDALGEAWLLRARQRQRTVPGRVDTARQRLRLYQSIVMLADVGPARAGERLSVLESLMALQQHLPRMPGL